MLAADIIDTWAEAEYSRGLAMQKVLLALLMDRLGVDEIRLEEGELRRVVQSSRVNARLEPGGAMVVTREPRELPR